MKKSKNIIWGLVLIIIGAIFALNALDITDIDIFFDGWWTLFIIVPCVVGFFKEQDKMGNLIGVAIGVFLLLACQDVLSFAWLWKLVIPIMMILIGVKLIFKGMFGNKGDEIMKTMKQAGKNPKVGCAVFSGCDINYNGQEFEGAALTAVFGGVECDLRNAIIDQDCAIQVSAIFGGIDILVPSNVNVKVNTNCIFGGISNKAYAQQDAPTIYITGVCMFGGVEIK